MRVAPLNTRLSRYRHLLFVLPALLLYTVFIIYPTLSAFRLSLFDWNFVGTRMNYIGLDNYQHALTSPEFYTAMSHNAIYFVAVFAFQNTVGLFLALQLNARPRLAEFYRTILFLPVIISLVATGFIWSLILSPNIGFLNPLLKDIGLGVLARPWLSDKALALPVVIGVDMWHGLGWAIVIYLAGLQNVPHDLIEAAEIDGANGWQTFRNVVFPLLAPAFTSLTVLTFITTFRVFDVVYVLAGPTGAPAGTTDVLGTMIYRNAFGVASAYSSTTSLSYAMAVTVIVFILLAICSTFLLVGLRRREVQA